MEKIKNLLSGILKNYKIIFKVTSFFALLFLLFLLFDKLFPIIKKFDYADYQLIKEYVEIFLSWPIAFLIVSLIIIFRFSDQIKNFLENLCSIKFGSFEAASQGQVNNGDKIQDEIHDNLEEKGITLTREQALELEADFKKLAEEKDAKIAESESKDKLVEYLTERAEVYEFSYLNLFLVLNTKYALLWFFQQYNHCSTKENYLIGFNFNNPVPNPGTEKEIIFNVLLSNQLLVLENGLYKITDKGVKFLRFIGLIT